MKYSTTLLLVVCTAAAWADPGMRGHGRGPHGSPIASCEADRATRSTCIKGKMQTFGDVDKIKACFASCSRPKNNFPHKGGEQAATGDRATMQQFFKCQQQQRQSCIASKSNVAFATDASATNHDDNMGIWGGHGGMHGGKGGWKGKGNGESKGNGVSESKGNGGGEWKGKGQRREHGDMLAMLLRRAEHCNVTACVKPLIRSDLLANTTAGSATVKKAMCEARQSCQPSAKCEADRAAVKKAACACKQQAEATTSPNPCMTPAVQALFAAKQGSSGSSGSHHQFKGKGGGHDPCSTDQVKQKEVC